MARSLDFHFNPILGPHLFSLMRIQDWVETFESSDLAIVLLKFWLVEFPIIIMRQPSHTETFQMICETLSSAIPSSLYVLRKGMSDHTTFTKFVVCPNCDKLYRFSDCADHSGGCQRSKKCTFVCYPDHPHLNSRAPCDCILLKKVTQSSSVKMLYPMKTHPYKPLFTRDLLLRPGFADLCQCWKTQTTVSESKLDVYDIKIWSDFQIVDGKPFLSCGSSLCLGLMLNVDWFQPFRYSTYSV